MTKKQKVKKEVPDTPDYLDRAKTEMNKFIKEMIAAGKVTKQEGEKLFRKFWKDSEDERETIKDKLEEVGSDFKKLIDAPSREEFEALKKRVKELEKR